MADIIVTLRSLLDNLPASEKRVADYIIGHPNEVPFLSIHKLAEAGKTSVASVTRLAHRAGCGSFKELKIQLARGIDSEVAAVFEGISGDDSDETCIQKVFGGNIRSLQDTLRMVGLQELRRTAAAIARAGTTVFIGFGSSGYIAGDASLRFTHLGLRTGAYREPIEMMLNASLLQKGDVFVALSHSGRTEITRRASAEARKQGALTVGISNYPASPLAKGTDIFLCTAFSENLTRAAAVSSRISQICILDALHVITARHLENRTFIDRANKLVEEEFRK
jgi:RpiR family transcriptional regulator, carbohydrate utilization regulator